MVFYALILYSGQTPKRQQRRLCGLCVRVGLVTLPLGLYWRLFPISVHFYSYFVVHTKLTAIGFQDWSGFLLIYF